MNGSHWFRYVGLFFLVLSVTTLTRTRLEANHILGAQSGYNCYYYEMPYWQHPCACPIGNTGGGEYDFCKSALPVPVGSNGNDGNIYSATSECTTCQNQVCTTPGKYCGNPNDSKEIWNCVRAGVRCDQPGYFGGGYGPPQGFPLWSECVYAEKEGACGETFGCLNPIGVPCY